MWKLGLRPHNSQKRIHEWDFCCSMWAGRGCNSSLELNMTKGSHWQIDSQKSNTFCKTRDPGQQGEGMQHITRELNMTGGSHWQTDSQKSNTFYKTRDPGQQGEGMQHITRAKYYQGITLANRQSEK
jgi:hypothetical protein